MRHFKILLVAITVIMSTAVFAGSAHKFHDPSSISSEIEKLVQESNFEVGKEFTVTVFFSISEDQRIQSLSVASKDEKLNQFLQQKLAGQELPGELWMQGKIYEVSVVLK